MRPSPNLVWEFPAPLGQMLDLQGVFSHSLVCQWGFSTTFPQCLDSQMVRCAVTRPDKLPDDVLPAQAGTTDQQPHLFISRLHPQHLPPACGTAPLYTCTVLSSHWIPVPRGNTSGKREPELHFVQTQELHTEIHIHFKHNSLPKQPATNAQNTGSGVVLLQHQGNAEHPVIYLHRKPLPTDRNLSPI